MNRRAAIPAVLLTVLLAGCTADNTQRLTQAHDLYNGVEEGLTVEIQAGRIDRAGVTKIVPVRNAAKQALSALDSAVTGDGPTFDRLSAAFDAAMASLSGTKVAVEKPATRP